MKVSKRILLSGHDIKDIQHSVLKTGADCKILSKFVGFFSEKEIIYEIEGEEELVERVISELKKACEEWDGSSPYVNSVRASLEILKP